MNSPCLGAELQKEDTAGTREELRRESSSLDEDSEAMEAEKV